MWETQDDWEDSDHEKSCDVKQILEKNTFGICDEKWKNEEWRNDFLKYINTGKITKDFLNDLEKHFKNCPSCKAGIKTMINERAKNIRQKEREFEEVMRKEEKKFQRKMLYYKIGFLVAVGLVIGGVVALCALCG